MSAECIQRPPRKPHVSPVGMHDYLYDSAFLVSGARDYARAAFKAAMASAQPAIQPVFTTMFSTLSKYPTAHIVYHPNCRLPSHMDRSYGGYLKRVEEAQSSPVSFQHKDIIKYIANPKRELLTLKHSTPHFIPPSPATMTTQYSCISEHEPTRPRNRGTQSVYRETSAQTIPWQPDGRPANACENVPEVMYLDKLDWGPGCPYRTGDLPADFHTTEIINKMRHARTWNQVAEKGIFPRWMKRRDQIISDVETKDWIFREAEIDELQDIRLEILHRMQSEKRTKHASKIGQKLSKRWAMKKLEMEHKIDHIRRNRDRELRKLEAVHSGGGRLGLVQRSRASRGGGCVVGAAADPASDLYAPALRNGFQARGRHAEITYDASLLLLEDHEELARPPPWLESCGQNLRKTCSGHPIKNDPMQLCERETKWSENFLENLHNDLKKARLGAAETGAGPLHVLKPRRPPVDPRPDTPVVESVSDKDESVHQAALLLQRIIRGRAVQSLMYEGRTRAAELTEELKTTHGLQKEDKVRIAKEETKAREYNALRTDVELKEDAVTALVDELCGSAVSAALDFLEKELRRLKEERRQHAFILIALREKEMREAAEAGRRQKEEHRRREHDEMFKQIVGVTQETVDAYLATVIQEGVELGAEQDAARAAAASADHIDQLNQNESHSTAEQNELVAELVHQFLLPHVHQTASRHHLESLQKARLEAARQTIFSLFEKAEEKDKYCIHCGVPIGEKCRCDVCVTAPTPIATKYRHDPRLKTVMERQPEEKAEVESKFTAEHDLRGLMNATVDDAVETSRRARTDACELKIELQRELLDNVEMTLEIGDTINMLLDMACGRVSRPVKKSVARYYMRRVIGDALERSEPFVKKILCPAELPSAARERRAQAEAAEDPSCRCDVHKSGVRFGVDVMTSTERVKLLPSELRELEDMRKCKCDQSHTTSERGHDTTSTVDSEGFTYESTSDDRPASPAHVTE